MQADGSCGAQSKASAAEAAPTSDRWLDPSGYPLGALNPNEALNCVDDINRVVLQVFPISSPCCHARLTLGPQALCRVTTCMCRTAHEPRVVFVQVIFNLACNE